MIGSLAGNGVVTNRGAASARLTIGYDNTNTTFSGTLVDGTSALRLAKIGTGTLTLTGNNTYSGGTRISGGFLQIGNGGTTGSISGDVTNNGWLVFGRSDNVTFDGKSSKSSLEPVLQSTAGNHWGVWATGFGDFVNVDADRNAPGYNLTTGGVSVGIDYRVTDNLAVGVMANYSHTWTDLQPTGHIGADTGRLGLYATWFSRTFYVNGGIYGGYNTYNTSRESLGGLATGDTDGEEFSAFISGGHDFHFGHLTVGPIASLQYTCVNINGFSENSRHCCANP
jgi:autotransporter-associated beta strand protein